jgi:hypothetical protein
MPRRFLPGLLLAAGLPLFTATLHAADDPATPAAAQATTANPAADEPPVYIDPAQFLPPGLSKPCTRDFNGETLEEVVGAFQSITGMPFRLDLIKLQDAGVGTDVEVRVRSYGHPTWLVMNRAFDNVNGVQLAWSLEDGAVVVTTEEEIVNRMQTSVIDVGPLLKHGFDSITLLNTIQVVTSEPWMEVDGEGGELNVVRNVLTVRQTLRGEQDTRALLKALESDAYEVLSLEPEIHRALREAMEKPLPIDMIDVPLSEVLEEVSRRIDVPIELDNSRLQDAGIGPDQPVTIKRQDVRVRNLWKDINGVQCALQPWNGVLRLTTEEETVNLMRVVVFHLPELAGGPDDVRWPRIVTEMTSEPWMEVDGEGGEIVQVPRALVVRQTEVGLDETRSLIHDIRKTLVRPEPLTAEELAKVEVRYYRLSEKMAADLFDTIPRLVAPKTWAGVGAPDNPGLIFRTEVPARSNSGGLGSHHGPGMGTTGMPGGTGGGFFAMNDAPNAAAGSSGGTSPVTGTSPREESKDNVLIIRQTVSIHQEIEKLIADLLDPDPDACIGTDEVVDTWKSRLKPETTGSTP